jgi:hypothetical protein
MRREFAVTHEPEDDCSVGGPGIHEARRHFVRYSMLIRDTTGAGLSRLMKDHRAIGGKLIEREVLRQYLNEEEIEEYLKRNNLSL